MLVNLCLESVIYSILISFTVQLWVPFSIPLIPSTKSEPFFSSCFVGLFVLNRSSLLMTFFKRLPRGCKKQCAPPGAKWELQFPFIKFLKKLKIIWSNSKKDKYFIILFLKNSLFHYFEFYHLPWKLILFYILHSLSVELYCQVLKLHVWEQIFYRIFFSYDFS